MAEGEEQLGLLAVVIAIPHKDTLTVFGRVTLAAVKQVRGVVRKLFGKALGKLAGGVHLAEEDAHRGKTDRLAAQIGFQYGLDTADPGHLDRRAVVQHDDRVGVGGGNGLDQTVLAVGHAHVRAVIALGFVHIGQPGKDHRDPGAAGRLDGFADHLICGTVVCDAVSPSIADFQAFGRFQGRGGFEAVDVRAAAALEAGLFGEFPDKGDLVLPGERQDAFFVLEQDHAVGRDLGREQMLGFLVPGRFGLCVLDEAIDDVEDPLDGLIDDGLVQLARTDRLDDLPVVEAAGGRHLKIQAGFHTRHAVRDGAPVAHHIAFKAPLPAQHLSQQPGVFRGKDAVDAVVRAHDRPGLFLLDGGLKGGEVDFAQCALIHVGARAHAPVLLRVDREVLDAGAHVPALDAVDQGRGHLTGQIRILREVLKVAAAEGRALDVDRRPEDDGELFVLAGIADGLAHPAEHLSVEGGCRGAGRREADRLDAVVDAEVVNLLILLAQAVRAVADHAGGDAQTLYSLRVPEVGAGAEPGLFLQRELGNKRLDIHKASFIPPLRAGPPWTDPTLHEFSVRR